MKHDVRKRSHARAHTHTQRSHARAHTYTPPYIMQKFWPQKTLKMQHLSTKHVTKTPIPQQNSRISRYYCHLQPRKPWQRARNFHKAQGHLLKPYGGGLLAHSRRLVCSRLEKHHLYPPAGQAAAFPHTPPRPARQPPCKPGASYCWHLHETF